MMHPFEYLSKGPVSNQAARGSHPHHCAQVAIFDGVINICVDAVPQKKNGTAAIGGRSLLWAALQTKAPPLLHAVRFTGGI